MSDRPRPWNHTEFCRECKQPIRVFTYRKFIRCAECVAKAFRAVVH